MSLWGPEQQDCQHRPQSSASRVPACPRKPYQTRIYKLLVNTFASCSRVPKEQFWTKLETLHNPRSEGIYQDVRPFHELSDNGIPTPSLWIWTKLINEDDFDLGNSERTSLRIYSDGSLAPREDVWRGGGVGTRAIDTDNLSTEVGQDHAHHWARRKPRELGRNMRLC